MSWAGRWLLDVLFPSRCPACSAASQNGGFCSVCSATIAYPEPPICPSCGASLLGAGVGHLCSRCLTRRPRFDRARACAVYRDSSATTTPLGLALHRYKYGGDVTLGAVLGRFMTERCPCTVDHDLIVPVPLHPARLRSRGFNQSLLLGRPLARKHGVAISPFVLKRRRPTLPQVGLGEGDRQRNLAGAIEVRDRARVENRSVLVLDDVYTTGATVNECARALREAGARRIDVLVLARAEGRSV
jgi:ComF family protein